MGHISLMLVFITDVAHAKGQLNKLRILRHINIAEDHNDEHLPLTPNHQPPDHRLSNVVRDSNEQ
jgi:hypothetical protein